MWSSLGFGLSRTLPFLGFLATRGLSGSFAVGFGARVVGGGRRRKVSCSRDFSFRVVVEHETGVSGGGGQFSGGGGGAFVLHYIFRGIPCSGWFGGHSARYFYILGLVIFVAVGIG